MLVKTILNHVQKQPGFVYGTVRFVEARGAVGLEVEIRRWAGGRPTCSGCTRPRPGYDTLPARRRFEFVPLGLRGLLRTLPWNLKTYKLMPRPSDRQEHPEARGLLLLARSSP